MTNPRDLIRSRGAPVPLARPIPTEVRTDGGLMINLLHAPYWRGRGSHPVLAEWVWHLSLNDLLALRTFLVTPDPETGIQPEAAIDAALKDHGIGSYLGTFVTHGSNFNQVRVLFGHAPKSMTNAYADKPATDPASFNRLIYDLLQKTDTQASRNLRYLRRLWSESPTRTETRLIMLSQVDLASELSDPENSPFTADLLSTGTRMETKL